MKMFRSSLRGFKKSDVNNYIIEIHREFADRIEELEGEVHRLSTENGQMSAELTSAAEAKKTAEEANARAEKAKRELEEAARENETLKAGLSSLEEELARLKNALKEAESSAERSENAGARANELLKLISDAPSANLTPSTDADGVTNPFREKLDHVKLKIKRLSTGTLHIFRATQSTTLSVNDFIRFSEKLSSVSGSIVDSLARTYATAAEKVLSECSENTGNDEYTPPPSEVPECDEVSSSELSVGYPKE